MVQPYLEAVDRDGETALLYLGGEFSHAVRKAALLPRGGEIRARASTSKSASARPSLPPTSSSSPSARWMRCRSSAAELLYARVDLLPGPVVLEVELTEPSLFLGYGEGSAERFADAITAASQRRRISAENGPIASQ